MSKNIHIAASPLTGAIFAGSVLKDGRTWGANKKDVTIEALVAVAEHAVKFGKPVEISKPDGTLEFRIIVQKPEPQDAEKAVLKDCPFCGAQPVYDRRPYNPSAGCKTDGCWGGRLPLINLDDPEQVAQWNSRPE